MSNLPPATPDRTMPLPATELFAPTEPIRPAMPTSTAPSAATQPSAPAQPSAARPPAATPPAATPPTVAPPSAAPPAATPSAATPPEVPIPAAAEPLALEELLTPVETQDRARSHVNGPRTALVVLVGVCALAVAFIIMVFVGVSTESINALAVIVAPIASMIAAYYGITLSIQQVRNERAEKDKAIARMDAADASSRETEVWAAQMESGLRVAMAKLNAARIDTDEVTKAAGTPDGFF